MLSNPLFFIRYNPRSCYSRHETPAHKLWLFDLYRIIERTLPSGYAQYVKGTHRVSAVENLPICHIPWA